jgi:hypothetical protein
LVPPPEELRGLDEEEEPPMLLLDGALLSRSIDDPDDLGELGGS